MTGLNSGVTESHAALANGGSKAGRLAKPARREQLLDTALTLVREQGTDGLTLATLAEAAGVSRPIVYDHFGTRPELLLALYRQLDPVIAARLASPSAVVIDGRLCLDAEQWRAAGWRYRAPGRLIDRSRELLAV